MGCEMRVFVAIVLFLIYPACGKKAKKSVEEQMDDVLDAVGADNKSFGVSENEAEDANKGVKSMAHCGRHGIVTCAYSVTGKISEQAKIPHSMAYLDASIQRLREVGYNGCIKIFAYWPTAYWKLREAINQKLLEVKKFEEMENVFVSNLKDVIDDDDMVGIQGDYDVLRGYDCKIMALLHSPFEVTAMMEPNAMFLVNPAQLFSHPMLVNTGTMFFYERPADNPHTWSRFRCEEIEEFAEDPFLHYLPDFKFQPGLMDRHEAYCMGSRYQSGSFLLWDRSHPDGAKALKMLKNLHMRHIVKDRWFERKGRHPLRLEEGDPRHPPRSLGWNNWVEEERMQVRLWSFEDNEFYWLACEFAGVACSFSRAWRPMHVFYEEEPIEQREKQGCIAQIVPGQRGKPSDGTLLYMLLDDTCQWRTMGLNAVTAGHVTAKNDEDCEGFDEEDNKLYMHCRRCFIQTKNGVRLLSDEEKQAVNTFALRVNQSQFPDAEEPKVDWEQKVRQPGNKPKSLSDSEASSFARDIAKTYTELSKLPSEEIMRRANEQLGRMGHRSAEL
eukprot:gnl/TRDRNA2_/TRDRNA2_41195_c0_seq1.p1 gnl/TRDRNA2_/TRDRNA2_41195_c0~~gnl/TRDRNA2_/TRDRNA2_41195_c0_seq1.p1  ORF type:complete len:567 (-),score=82.89 gnl/TRDRNA2_/TRDRNA2_41195_c0_seq1:95-1759(-)